MKKGLLITLPRHETVTEYLAHFSKEITVESKRQNIPCKEIIGEDVNKANFQKLVRSTNYKLLVLNGHVTEDTIRGHKDEIIVGKGINEELLNKRITYARACDAATSLGKNLIKEDNEGCFIGYELPFQFYRDATWELNPAKDKIAPLFLEPSNKIPISILKGKSTLEAHENSKRQMLKNITKVLRNPNNDSLPIAEALWNNYEGQVLLGNP